MRVPLAFALALFACVSLVGSRAVAAPPVPVRIDISVANQTDKRLDQTVSLEEKSILLSSLLNKISKQTGVVLTIAGGEPSSGNLMCVRCKNLPLHTLLNALYGCVSGKWVEWAWRREGEPGSCVYNLFETPWARDKDANYKRIIDGLMQRYVDVMHKLSDMPEEERARHRVEMQNALMLEDARDIDAFFSGDQKDWIWSQARFFFKALTPEQQKAVLDDHSVSVDLSALPNDVYSLYHQHYLFSAATVTDAAGNITQIPEPRTVEVYRDRQKPEKGFLGPAIAVRASGQMSGYSWMATGYFEKGVAQAIKRQWMLPGDASANPKHEAFQLPKIEEPPSLFAPSGLPVKPGIGGFQHMPTLEDRLMFVSTAANVPVVALIRMIDPQSSSRPPEDRSTGAVLKYLEQRMLTNMYKWREGVLVFSYPLWFAARQPAIAADKWALLGADAEGWASLQAWSKFAKATSVAEFDWMMQYLGTYMLKSKLHPALILAEEHPEAGGTEGFELAADDSQRTREVEGLHLGDIANQSHVRLRLQVKSPNVSANFKILTIEFRSGSSANWTPIGWAPLPRLPVTDAAAPRPQ